MGGGGGVVIQSERLATTIIKSSSAHSKRMSQLRISIASYFSAPSLPKSFNETHVTSSSVKLRGTILGMSLYSMNDAHAEFSTGGDLCVKVVLPDDLHDRLHSLSAKIL